MHQENSQLHSSIPLLLLGLGLLLLSLALLPGLALLLLQLGVLLHRPVPTQQQKPEHIDTMVLWPQPCRIATHHLYADAGLKWATLMSFCQKNYQNNELKDKILCWSNEILSLLGGPF